jgi:peroxiredoxin
VTIVRGKLLRWGFIVVAVILTVGLAYILGVEAGNYYIKAKRSKNFILTRNAQTAQILQQMNTIAVGDTLLDHTFQDLNGNPVKLSEVLSEKTVIDIFDLGCEACLVEIQAIHEVVRDESDFKYFVLISSGAPVSLTDLRQQYNLRCPILYDENHEFFSELNIMGIPFNMIVTKDRIIEKIVSGTLTEDELREVIKHNKNR